MDEKQIFVGDGGLSAVRAIDEISPAFSCASAKLIVFMNEKSRLAVFLDLYERELDKRIISGASSRKSGMYPLQRYG